MGGKGSGRKKAVRVNIDPSILSDEEILYIALGKPLAENILKSKNGYYRRDKKLPSS